MARKNMSTGTFWKLDKGSPNAMTSIPADREIMAFNHPKEAKMDIPSR